MPDCRTDRNGPPCCPVGSRSAKRQERGVISRRGTTMTMVSRYHPLLVVLHWVMALLIIAALALGALVMVKIPNTDPMKFEALRSHMSGGMAILVLMLIRLVIRSRTAHPAPVSAGHPLLDRLAWLSHRMFYGTVVVMAGSGIVMALQTGLFDTV